MKKNAQCDFWQPKATKNVGKLIWAFTDNNEKCIEVGLAFDDGGKMFWGEFDSRKSVKIMYMVHGQLMNAQTTPDFRFLVHP
jgi:hypothetical protein